MSHGHDFINDVDLTSTFLTSRHNILSSRNELNQVMIKKPVTPAIGGQDSKPKSLRLA